MTFYSSVNCVITVRVQAAPELRNGSGNKIVVLGTYCAISKMQSGLLPKACSSARLQHHIYNSGISYGVFHQDISK